MNKKRMKAILSVTLAGMMVFGLVPYTAQAEEIAEIQTGKPTFVVNQSVVAFAGEEWWVIGNETSGVNPVEGTVTLLAKDNNFDNSAFREGSENQIPGFTQYSEDGWWYAGSGWDTPNEYAGSTLQGKMTEIADDLNSRESALIKARTLDEGMNGGNVSNQKLWALSKSEWETISRDGTNGTTVLGYGNWWWLRSPYPSTGDEPGSALATAAICTSLV